MKRWRAQLGLLAVLASAALAQSTLTVDQLVSFVKSSVQLHHDDPTIAAYIKKNVKLANRLDARTVEDLQGSGAGPQTVAALKALITESATLSEARAAARSEAGRALARRRRIRSSKSEFSARSPITRATISTVCRTSSACR